PGKRRQRPLEAQGGLPLEWARAQARSDSAPEGVPLAIDPHVPFVIPIPVPDLSIPPEEREALQRRVDSHEPIRVRIPQPYSVNREGLPHGAPQYSPEAEIIEIPLLPHGHQTHDSAPLERQPVYVPDTEAPPSGKRSEDKGQVVEFPHGPRSLTLDDLAQLEGDILTNKHRRRRRAAHQEEDIGVASSFNVISGADLNFEPNGTEEVTVFQGKRISEEVVYGVCLPAGSFTALFLLISLCTVIAVFTAAFMCYHRERQKQTALAADGGVSPAVRIRDWNMIHFLRDRFVSAPPAPVTTSMTISS
ncbi:unnamed protein product, partial [Cyprideis torosa]